MNSQKVEKAVDNEMLDVVKVFLTIQGEGPLSGIKSVFVRLGGCSLQCKMCVVGKTEIASPSGRKPISDLRVGDLVYGWDGNQVKVFPVTQTMESEVSSLLKISFERGKPLYVTSEHPGWIIGKGWVNSGSWKVGDVLFQLTTSDTMTVSNPMKDPDTVCKVQQTRLETGANERTRQATLTYWSDPENKEKASQRMKDHNPMADVEVRKKSWTNRTHKLTSIERFVWEVIQELELPIDYTGDGSFWVGEKCPDFKVRNTFKVIEVWDNTQTDFLGRDEEYIAQRKAYFQQQGFECLVLAFNPFEFRNSGDPKGTGKTNCRIWLTKQLTEFIHNGLMITGIELIDRWSQPKAYTRLAGSLNASIKVYNLEVSGCHNYFARSVLLHNCDTDYTSGRHLMSVRDVVSEVEKYDCQTVVLTGGEPFRQKGSMKLIEALSSKGITCQVETSGSCWFDDWKSVPEHCIIVCSPKTGKVVSGIIPWVDYYKYIISWDGVGQDGLPNVSPITGKPLKLFRPVANRTGKIPGIYVSPWDVKDVEINRKNQEAATCSCFKHGYRLSLQIHKLIGVE